MTISFWLGQRLHDFWMWPFNLVRDFPVRSGRLAGTVTRGLKAATLFLPDMGNAIRQKSINSWLGAIPGRYGRWLHLFIMQSFDLLGGPEIVEFLMHLITHTTPLTIAETDLITSILGWQGMRYQDVRVAQGGLLDLVFKYNGNLAYTTWHTVNLPRHYKGDKANHTRTNFAHPRP